MIEGMSEDFRVYRARQCETARERRGEGMREREARSEGGAEPSDLTPMNLDR